MSKHHNTTFILSIVFILFLVIPSYAAHTGSKTAYIPAVYDTEIGYQGVLATVTVDVIEGTGHVYLDTLPLTEIDTQSSARLAKEVSGNILGIDMEQYDLLYTIRSDSPIIGGPSAGGAITAITMATLLELDIDNSVVMTGTINPDGSIGPIGGVLEKAQAVAENGGRLFLIPEGQSMVTLQKTEHLVGGNSIQIVTQTETVDVVKYAKENLGIDVMEVNNVKDALKYMTGYEIKTRVAHNLEKSETVDEIMKVMASLFISNVEESYSKIQELFDNSDVPMQYSSDLEELLNAQENNIAQAKHLFDEEKYYSASSKAFFVGIQLNYVKNMITVLESSSITKSVQNVIETADDMIDIEEKIINKSVINSITDVEIISASEERLNEAKNNIEESRRLFYNMQYADAVYAASYAMERSNSAVMWYNLINSFNSTDFEFNYSSLQGLAQRRIDDADASIIYAQSIGLDASGAVAFLNDAKININDDVYLSALSNAVLAKANANFIMELRGLEDLTIKVDGYDRNALTAIEDAQDAGAVPILALSYYEFAHSFNENDAIGTKLLYLKYAKEFASLSLDLISFGSGADERQIEVDIAPVQYTDPVFFAFAGFFVGIFFLFFVLKFGRWL